MEEERGSNDQRSQSNISSENEYLSARVGTDDFGSKNDDISKRFDKISVSGLDDVSRRIDRLTDNNNNTT